ncbi:hypothetical protein HPP92_027720 [Vanilla planifolia]|uniref:Uncharacterized protein n=1 Tax=Vanilla planifolia TaxID=51239 RepID=A0A835P9Y5_VANPL|nr:hypothetical protein HPP92_027720 [Vanilla planifolia]
MVLLREKVGDGKERVSLITWMREKEFYGVEKCEKVCVREKEREINDGWRKILLMKQEATKTLEEQIAVGNDGSDEDPISDGDKHKFINKVEEDEVKKYHLFLPGIQRREVESTKVIDPASLPQPTKPPGPQIH